MKLNKNKGITLIALVVTIIVLLILAGVTLSLALNNNGIIGRSKNAVAAYKEAEEAERAELDAIDNFLRGPAIDITYYVPEEETESGRKVIQLYFEIVNSEEDEMMNYWKYSQKLLKDKTESEMEEIWMKDMRTNSIEAVYQLLGATTKEGAEKRIKDAFGVDYTEGLKLNSIMSVGLGNLYPITEYVLYVEGVSELSKTELENAFYEEFGETWEEWLKNEKGYSNEGLNQYKEIVGEEYAVRKAYALASTDPSNESSIFNKLKEEGKVTFSYPDGTTEEVYKFLGFAIYPVTENGEYEFSAIGLNGEEGEVTVNVTGIETPESP